MPRPKIFISYSHKDENEKNHLVTHLRVLQTAAGVVEDVWHDGRIQGGQEWKQEIERAMEEATIAVLLISVNSLTSDYVLNVEVQRLLTRREKEGVIVYPILAKPCYIRGVEWLAKLQIRPLNLKPVWREGGRYAEDELATITEEIADMIAAAQRQQAQLERERLAREQAAAEQARLAEEQAEIERLAQEHITQERQARIRAAAERLAREQLEQEEKEREKLEQERIAKEKAEQERIAKEKAEQERVAKEKAEQERIAKEKAAQERIARERQEKEERERLTREKPQHPLTTMFWGLGVLFLTLAPNLTLELVRVPAGEFWMGSDKSKDKDADNDELPQHKVHLDAYLIGKYPVTVAQFAAFVKATKHKTQAEKDGSSYTWTGSDWKKVKGADWQHPRGPKSDVRQKQNHPVTHISWDDARAFCEWASKVTSRTVRLPTEAEWEKAARGGLPSPSQGDPLKGAGGQGVRVYPWGDQPPTDKLCNFNLNVKDTTPVGQYSPQGDSPYGCADMAGNVWEWTSSLFKGYKYDPKDGRENLDADGLRVLRGGSFLDDQRDVRCACRNGPHRHNHLELNGFRIFCAPSL
jgi:formylglycine-generating enzyme required for sulfatase activity